MVGSSTAPSSTSPGNVPEAAAISVTIPTRGRVNHPCSQLDSRIQPGAGGSRGRGARLAGRSPVGVQGPEAIPPAWGALARARQQKNAMLLCAGAQCGLEIRAAQAAITFRRRGNVRDGQEGATSSAASCASPCPVQPHMLLPAPNPSAMFLPNTHTSTHKASFPAPAAARRHCIYCYKKSHAADGRRRPGRRGRGRGRRGQR